MTGLDILLVIGAGLLGLVVGSFLNVVAYRVSAGGSLRGVGGCPRCDAMITPWHSLPVIGWAARRGRCASCAARISARYAIVEASTGVLFAAVTWWMLTQGALSSGAAVIILVAFLYLAAVSIVLTLIDLDTRRLPNIIVLPSYLVGGVLLTAASLLTDGEALLRAGVGMVALFTFYFLLRLVRAGGMGGGDVKLAGVLGLYLGWVGWGALVVGALAAFLIGGIWGIVLIITGRAGRGTAIPFGPWMIVGAWVGVFVGDTIGRWYVNLLVGS